jgi:hypothetical protein
MKDEAVLQDKSIICIVEGVSRFGSMRKGSEGLNAGVTYLVSTSPAFLFPAAGEVDHLERR